MTTLSLQDLDGILEAFVCAPHQQRDGSFRELVDGLKAAAAEGRTDQVVQVLRRSIIPTLTYTSVQSLYRIYKRLPVDRLDCPVSTDVAILGSATTTQLSQLIELCLFAAGVRGPIHEAEYGTFRQEIFDPTSDLYAAAPQIVYLATTWRDLSHCPSFGCDHAAVQERVDAEVADWATLWQTAHDRLGCQIIQDNFAPPSWRLLDNLELRHPAGLGNYITRINLALAESAPKFVAIHDVDHLAATAGRRSWSDERFYHHAKLPCAPEYLLDYAHSVASVIAAQLGRGRKCLVLDLDNTLWGGVIGDDGLGGIRLGQGNPEGEAFLAFQRYAKGLQLRGVLLAVCSKNEEATAAEVFDKHPEMVLRRDDISCFVANWADKATNLRTIAKTLNIGLDSLVFADDNPAERALVRQLAPEVAVAEMPPDPADYVATLERHRWFQLISLGAEDLKRTDYYRANAQRQRVESDFSSVQGFLESLAMEAKIGPIADATLERSVQLIGKSNQFNLTTRRYSSGDVLEMLQCPAWVTRTISLSDRFGDNGLISVLLARLEGKALRIDTWLMSCRVLKRDVEHLALNHLYELAVARGAKVIRGEYLPTAKNGLVRDHYRKLGFTLTDTDQNGRTCWELPVGGLWEPLKHFIKEIATDG